jgi:two-component system sensor histidine kinase ChiS
MIKFKRKFKMRHLIYLIIFIVLLVAVRWSWHNQFASRHAPAAEQGVLDLRGTEIDASKPISLDGEWLFYPYQFIGDLNNFVPSEGKVLQVPGSWAAAFDETNAKAYGYGTYTLDIKLDRPLSEPLNFWFQSIYTASEVEINGKVLAAFGTLAEDKTGHVSETKSFQVTYDQPGETVLKLVVRVSNYDSPLQGGIIRSVQFGTENEVNRIYYYSIGFQLIVAVIFLLHGIYGLIIFLLNMRKKEFIYFFLIMLASFMTIVVHHHGLLFMWVKTDFTWMVKLKAYAYMGFSFFLLLMAKSLVGATRKGLLFYSYAFLLASYTLFLVCGPAALTLYTIEKGLYMAFYYMPLFWTAYYFLKMVYEQVEGALFLLFSVVCVINNILWGTLYYAGTSQFMFYPVDLIAAIASFSAHWFVRYFHQWNENRLLNTQLAEADRVKDRFLANTSHELRTPLHGIINIAQSVLNRKQQGLDEQSRQDMELLVMISRRMSLMLGDLLDVVRLQDKRIKVNMKTVQVQSLAAGVLDMLRFLSDGKQVELRMNMRDDVPPVYADEERLVQILINLLHNALKYTNEGSVELIVESLNRDVWIEVKDTGIGMDQAMQERAFKPYEQGGVGGGGIGLGLSICKELIELHGSELIVASRPGEGSSFRFKLAAVDEGLQAANRFMATAPADIAAEYEGMQLITETAAMIAGGYEWQEDEHPTRQLTEGSPVRVLAVDDDPVNLKVLMHILDTEHYSIEPVSSAREALRRLHQEHWDLVIADVMMPGMSGYELTQKIRERFTLYELPIILLTARSEPEDIYAGFRAGANDYVTKPVDALELKYRAWSLASLKHAVNDRLSMEAAYLQAQIHPHFLFNTLNSILALSDLDTEKMRELAAAFTSYLRISFNFLTAGQLVPLERELQLVENYLYIEQQRFEERLQVEWEVNVNADLLIPPLTVQPLVENAVRHGVMSQAKGGTVRIRVEKQAGTVRFSVEDTGIGMREEQISKLLSPAGKEKRGIGLLNTHSRLTRLYGQGLYIESKEGMGTAVSFVIPEVVRE